MKILDKLNKRKWIIVMLIFMIVGIVLIFTQYFGMFPLDDQYALDMANFYTQAQFFNNIELMDQSSRLSYFMIHLADYLFMFGFYQLIGVVIYRTLKSQSRLIYLVIIPYLAYLFDFIENILMDIHLIIYPKQIEFFGSIAGVSTFLKFAFLYLSLIVIVFALIYKYIIKRKKTT